VKKSALVTGGCGFVGSWLCEHLLDQGWEVWALDDLSTGSMRNVEHLESRDRFHVVVDTVLDRAVVNALVHRVDVVFHLAAAVGVRLIVENPVQTLVTNVKGTENVLDYCNRFSKRVLVASTSEVYGDSPAGVPLDEDARRTYGPITQRRWAYAGSKAIDEFLAVAYHDEFALDCVIVRLFNCAGPRQTGRYGMVVPRFVHAALAGAPIEVYGDGMQSRCFCHVNDTVRALYQLMTSGTYGIFNVGTQERVTILELAERVKRQCESESELVHVPYVEVYGLGIEDMLSRIPDTSKIEAELGWRAKWTLDELIGDVILYELAAAGDDRAVR